MKSVLFKEWDWEHDLGLSPIDLEVAKVANYAEAFFDWRDLPYRVVVHDTGDKFAYDYFYDEKGRIAEKRSLDETGNTVLIVRYEYDGDRKVAEVGWSTTGDSNPERVRCGS